MDNGLYKKMYLHLFNAVTDAINEPNHIKRIEILKLIIDIISVVVIEGCDVFLVFRANEIANYQTQVSMMEKSIF